MADLALNVKHKKIPRSDVNQSVVSQLNTSIGPTTPLNQSLGVGGHEGSDNDSYLGGAHRAGIGGRDKNKIHESQCSLQSGGSQTEAHPFFKVIFVNRLSTFHDDRFLFA
jgi:hypothetical protein